MFNSDLFNEQSTTPTDFSFSSSQIVSMILSSALTKNETEQIIQALKFKQNIIDAVLPNTQESQTVRTFLTKFWTWETSPYVREKNMVGHNIHRRYVDIMLSRAKNYWIPRIGNLPLGSLRQSHIKNIMWELANTPQEIHGKRNASFSASGTVKRKLAPETVNQIVRSITCPLKWAYMNGIIRNDVATGISFCHVVSKKRSILTMEQAKQVFSVEWKDKCHKLANMIAMCTGMRIGEVQALQVQDISLDTIHINHNWARADGLKCPKNGETRQVKIPHELYLLILEQMERHKGSGSRERFLFPGPDPNKPYNARHWTESLHKVLERLKIPDRENICFHSWRHFFVTYMSGHLEDYKLQVATGHKTQAMLEHYASHRNEQALAEVGLIQNQLFAPIISNSTIKDKTAEKGTLQ